MRFEQHRSATTVQRSRKLGGRCRVWCRFTALAVALAAGTPNLAAQNTPAQGVTDVVLGSGSFQIPFNIAAGGTQPREVHLYMAQATEMDSRQRGVKTFGDEAPKWKLLDRKPPSSGHFQVTQTPDGVFWFATRTIDAGGRPHPPGPIEPELKVTVDTTQPSVDLIADADADGKVTASFSIADATAASQITVHYVTDTLQQWQTAGVTRTEEGGQFAFAPADQWQLLSIRLRVLDAAGNESIIKKRVQKPRVATTGTTRLASSPLGFGNPLVLSGNSPALPPPSTADQISQDFGRAEPTLELLPQSAMSPSELLLTPEPESQPKPKTPAEAMRPLRSQAAPPERVSPPAAPPPSLPPSGERAPNLPDAPSRASEPAPETPFAAEAIPAPAGQPPAPTQLNRPALPETSDRAESADEAGASEPAPSPWSPLDSSRTRNPSREFSTTPTPRPVTPGELPLSPMPGSRSEVASESPLEQRRASASSVDPLNLERLSQRAVIRHSDSNQFSLDYEIEAIGGRGVEAIELYGTIDGGQTWKHWGSDPDKVSPFDIETNGEGIFGFQIVVVAANGLASPRPLAGDAPDIVVVVDQTVPVVGITGAKYGESDRAGSLVIAYHCEDRYLMSRPITLSFSDSPSGPWTTIAAGLRNTGDYVWPADPQLPRQIHLRIDAIDQAGNVNGYVLEEPIDTRGLAPRARIRAFRAIPSR